MTKGQFLGLAVMRLQQLRHPAEDFQVDGYYACVSMPVATTFNHAEKRFVRPLEKLLGDRNLGRVTGLATDDAGTLRITLSLATDAPSALKVIADLLGRLGAPAGSRVGHAECPDLFVLGKSGATWRARTMAKRQQTRDTWGSDDLVRGSLSVGDRSALCFHRDSLRRMQRAVTRLDHTGCEDDAEFARRLH